MPKFNVRLEWKVEEWYEIEAATEKEAYEQALDAPITNSKSLGIQVSEVYDADKTLIKEYF
jgi:hypothetical protein